MNLLDRGHTAAYVLRYDAWLELRGVARRDRRALRRELRGNLAEATAAVGARAATEGLGPPRALAAETAVAVDLGDPGRPRWSTGAGWAAVTVAALLVLWASSVLAFVDGADAAGASGRVVGELFPWGSAVRADVGSGLAVSATVPLAVPVLAALAFVAGARPWRLVGRRVSRTRS